MIYEVNKSSLFAAIEKENIDIVKLLLLNEKIDVNIPNIWNSYLSWNLKLSISIQLKKYILMSLKINYFNAIQNQFI